MVRIRFVKKNYYVTIYVIYTYLSNAASFCSRAQLGLPDNWSRVEAWLSSEEKTVVKNVIFSEIVRKNPEIPVLNDYRIKAEKSFWEKFPSKNLPSKPTTKINIVKLEEKIIESKAKLNNSSWNRAQKCLNYLKYGGPSFQSSYLPSCTVRNSTAAFENG